jgi:hypothetical protein
MRQELSALITDKNFHISEFYKHFFNRLGLEFNGECSVKDLIKKVQDSGIEIMSVLGIDYIKGLDFTMEIYKDEDIKEFFGNVLTRDNEEEESFNKIIECLPKVFILDELEIKSPVSSNITGYCFAYIRGLEKSDPQLLLNRTEVMVIKIPY